MNLIVPSGVVVVEAKGDMPDVFLLPEEAAALGSAAPIRRQEFSFGRSCARRALERLGLSPQPILRGPHREPVWPPGIAGSITHCRGYAAAAVAPQDQVATIGIDAELHQALPEGVLELIAVPNELSWIRAQSEMRICWDRVIFSAKESIFKAWFPLARRWLGFEDVCLCIEPQSASFEARLLVAARTLDGRKISHFRGRYRIDDDLVLSAAVFEDFA